MGDAEARLQRLLVLGRKIRAESKNGLADDVYPFLDAQIHKKIG